MNFINLISIQSVVTAFLFFSMLRFGTILMLSCIFLHGDCEFCVYTVQNVHIFATLCFNFA